MARIKNTNVYVFDTVPEASSFLVGSDQGDGRITKSYRIDTVFGLLPSYGYFTDAPADGQPYLRQDNAWVMVPPSGVGSVFSVFGRTGAVTGQFGDYSSFYAALVHTHTESDITDLQDYLLPADIGSTVQAWSAALDAVTGTNTGDQTSIVGISGTKVQFNNSLSDGDFMFIGDAPTAHTHVESDITDLQDYLLPEDIDTLSELNSLISDATLIDTDDSRLSDARTPLAHTHVEADITDLQDYLLSVDISDINAAGTASSSTWLRGDGVWGTILAGVSSVFGRTAEVVAMEEDYDDFYSLLGHTHTTSEITDLASYTGFDDYYTDTETDTLLSGYQLLSEKGQANGYVPLNGSSLIDSSYLPSYVDDVLEFDDLASFPVTGEIGKVYIALDTNRLYRWSGSTYVGVGGTESIPWGAITGTLSDQTDLQSALNGKENSFSKNTGFNKNFGTSAGTVSEGNHTHAFASLTSKPTTIGGYGITDFNSLGDVRWLRKDTNDTTTGTLRMAANSGITGSGSGTGNVAFFSFFESNGTTRQGYVGMASGSNSDVFLRNDVANSNLNLVAGGGVNGLTFTDSGGTGTVWTSRNDGEGSGLDADLLDGQQGANYMRVNAATTNTNGTNSTSKDTGALILTAGGLGVEQAIFSGGNMNAPNFVLTSDKRKKKDIKTLKVGNFPVKWKEFELKDFPGEKRYGVIAQDVQKYAPELVFENGKGELSVKYIDLFVKKLAEKDNQISSLEEGLELLEEKFKLLVNSL
jgi:hypothetical protein